MKAKEIIGSYRGPDGKYYTRDLQSKREVGESFKKELDGFYKYLNSKTDRRPIYFTFFVKGRQEGEEIDYIYQS